MNTLQRLSLQIPFPLHFDHLLNGLNRKRQPATMNDRVTVRTHWSQIPNGIGHRLTLCLRQRIEMMHMDVAAPKISVRLFEIEPACKTDDAIVLNA